MFTELTLMLRPIQSRPLLGAVAALVIGASLWLAEPFDAVFDTGYSRLVFDAEGRLLRATLAPDQQYRFPPDKNELPAKYIAALLTFEDKRFFSHPGVDPLALGNAFVSNLFAGKRIRGGSTITMQVARLAQPRKRTYLNKFYESLLAMKLTLHYSKKEILSIYATQAPMGGNVVGLRAASFRYFGKSMRALTWAEAALFAVLPNSPALINLKSQRPALIAKRNELLQRLAKNQKIDWTTCEMACAEPLPSADTKLPFTAPHLTQRLLEKSSYAVLRTSVKWTMQQQAEEAARNHRRTLNERGIANLAIVVAETKTGKVRAYVGSQAFADNENGGQVDGVQALRSTGSLLKPFLVARALDRGPFTMKSQIVDVPTFYGTFAPQNASKQFSGLAAINEVLIKSLNVPSVRLLNSYGVNDFYDFLKEAGLTGLFRTPEAYGLTLILGGAEASLYELTQLYLTLANYGKPMRLSLHEEDQDSPENRPRVFSAGAAWLVLNALTDLARPGTDFYWREFNDQVPVAWKTGTSYGQKDAWAIGCNPQWTIGVWVGNFSGEGNAALSGAQSAAPLLFSLFNRLTEAQQPTWFEKPEFDLREKTVCARSGYPAGPSCLDTATEQVPVVAHVPGICPFHRRFLIEEKTELTVCSLCWAGRKTTWSNRYIIPAAARELLQKSGHPVDLLPAHLASCPAYRAKSQIDLIYPIEGVKIFVPRDLSGKHERIVFSAKHHRPDSHLFWFLNGVLIGETKGKHDLPVNLSSGPHKLTIQDEEGVQRTVSFHAYRKAESRT